MSGEGHGEGLNYIGPIVTSAKIIICLATASSSSRYRILRDAPWKVPHEPREPKAECTSQGGKEKKDVSVREKRETRGSRALPSSTSPQDVVRLY